MAKFVPRQRKHRVLARQRAEENASTRDAPADSNAVELPARDLERERRKAELRAELRGNVKVSGKKAKRLEKYIDNKLRRDENRALQAKLEAHRIDTSLFMSTKTLGQGKRTKRQALTQALREERAGLEDDSDRKALLFRQVGRADSDDDDESEDEEEIKEETRGIGAMKREGKKGERSEANGVEKEGHPKENDEKGLERVKETASSLSSKDEGLSSLPNNAGLAVGSGLKRPLEVDDDGRPVLQKRQRRGGVTTKQSLIRRQPMQLDEDDDGNDDDDEWGGFSDSDAEISEEASTPDSGDNDSDSGPNDASDNDSIDGQNESNDDDYDDRGRRKRPPVFKSWAQAQINQAQGYEPIAPVSSTYNIAKPQNFTPRALEQDPLPIELQPTSNVERKAFSVAVQRTPEIQDARLKLPVVAEEQRIMEAIHNNDVVIICGATGSGKTTQVPQFLYEAGYGYRGEDGPTPEMIGITQPRRVAAVSMRERVAEELGDHGDRVAYQIRFEGNVDPKKTAIKFMTDGVLIREQAEDFLLRKYSVIIIDEAHERSANTDILVGTLSRVAKIRRTKADSGEPVKPLKLIIMSATLRIEDMTENKQLFSTPPPVVEVEGRQHPVTVHFARRTHHDYVDEAFKKVSRGHRKLPPGAFLVFLTGQNEIMQLIKRLRKEFNRGHVAELPKVQLSGSELPMEAEDVDFGDVGDDRNAEGLLSDQDDYEESDEEDDQFMVEDDPAPAPLNMHILPLYSQLPTREQLRVFQPPPGGSRLVIVATNVAETSLTIPGVRYVFDCGRSKERQYDKMTGVQTYEIGWISKASANQRSGRAGRTGPGHCYRLYSSAVFERDLAEFTDPEMLRMPLEGVILQLKSIINPKKAKWDVTKFPFPTPPGPENVAKAERILGYLSALSPEGSVSAVGKMMSIFPLSPRLARILLVGHEHDCIHYTIALVAALSAQEIFMPENQAIPSLDKAEDGPIPTAAENSQQGDLRRRYNTAHRRFCHLDDRSDAIKMLLVVGEFALCPTEKWCEDHFVRYKTLKEIQKLRKQIVGILRNNVKSYANLEFKDKLPPPTDKQVSALKSMVTSGFVDQVAIRADLSPTPPKLHRKPGRAIDVPYRPLTSIQNDLKDESQGLVYVHPSSPLAHLSAKELPKYVIYSYLQRATQGITDKLPKTRMHSLTDIGEKALSSLAKGTPLVDYGNPIKLTQLPTNSEADGWVREGWFEPRLRAENGREEWPLPAVKVKQKKVAGGRWVTIR